VSRRGQDERPAPSAAACAPRTTRQAYFGAWREVPVFALDSLEPGHSSEGPAVVEAETTTVLVDAGDRVTVNAFGWLDITLG
jgi:N-methylhydantoinase A